MRKTILIGFVLYSLGCYAQPQVAPATPAILNMGGGSAALTPDFIVDWNMGESTVTETWYGENAFANSIIGIHWNVTSGILQPYDRKHIIYNYLIPNWTNLEVRFYPVPTPNIVYIDFRSALTGKITIQLLTQEGKMIGIKEFHQTGGSNTQSWDLSNRASGIYLFRILLTSDKGDLLKQGTFKIEKNK